VVRTTFAGYAFSLFYEDGSRPDTPVLRVAGKDYYPKPPGNPGASEIFLPFPSTQQDVTLLLSDQKGLVRPLQVTLHPEQFLLEGSIGLEREALIASATAQIPIRCRTKSYCQLLLVVNIAFIGTLITIDFTVIC
jgi:hypothetical protein